MPDQPSNRVRSTIVKVPDASPGILFVNGQQRPFNLEGVWQSPVAPSANMTVDVDLDHAGTITAITVVESHQLTKERMSQLVTKERMSQLGGVAQEHGKEAAKLAQKGIGSLAARMGAVALASAVLVWIAWFFLPAAHMDVGGQVSFSFWDLLGLDFKNPESLAAGGSHGLFSFLGLIAIAAPFAAPFISAAWSKYLNVAPLAYVVLGLITIFSSEHSVFGQVAQLTGLNPFSWSGMIIVLLGASAVLAYGALKKPAGA